MRRLLIIVLMFVLPLQWSWAAAASVCAHETDVTVSHFGHHQHEHQSASFNEAADKDDDATMGYHADCGVCHGLGTALFPSVDGLSGHWIEPADFASYESAVPDRALDALFRPPLTPVS